MATSGSGTGRMLRATSGGGSTQSSGSAQRGQLRLILSLISSLIWLFCRKTRQARKCSTWATTMSILERGPCSPPPPPSPAAAFAPASFAVLHRLRAAPPPPYRHPTSPRPVFFPRSLHSLLYITSDPLLYRPHVRMCLFNLDDGVEFTLCTGRKGETDLTGRRNSRLPHIYITHKNRGRPS